MSELVGEVIDNTTFEEYSFKKNVYNNLKTSLKFLLKAFKVITAMVFAA